MDYEAKRLVLEHIEQQQYKEAFAILDDCKDDPETKRLLDFVDEMLVRDQTLNATKGLRGDKGIIAKSTEPERWWRNPWVAPSTIIAALLLLVTQGNVVFAALYFVCNWLYNRGRPLSPHRVFLGLLLSFSVYLGLYVVIMALAATS